MSTSPAILKKSISIRAISNQEPLRNTRRGSFYRAKPQEAEIKPETEQDNPDSPKLFSALCQSKFI